MLIRTKTYRKEFCSLCANDNSNTSPCSNCPKSPPTTLPNNPSRKKGRGEEEGAKWPSHLPFVATKRGDKNPKHRSKGKRGERDNIIARRFLKPRCGFCGCLNSQHFILVFFQGAGPALSGEEERYGDSRRRPSFFLCQ